MFRYEKNRLLKKGWFLRFGILTLSALVLPVLLVQGCSSETQSTKMTGNTSVGNLGELIAGPRLVLDTDVYDFGTIGPGDSKIGKFKLTNSGDETLLIKEVKKCCGAVIELDKQEIPPGENALLTAKYSAGLSTITFKKNITLVTNDPGNLQKILTIEGNVVQTLDWSPKSFEIATFRPEEKLPDITIKSLNNTPFSIKGFNASNKALTADFDPQMKATEFILKPKTDMEKLDTISNSSGVVSILLDHPDYKSVRVAFQLLKPLQVSPAQIVFMNVMEGEPIEKTLEIHDNISESNENISEQIESVKSEKGTKVEVLKSDSIKNGCKLYLKFLPSKDENVEEGSPLRDELVIKMKDGRQLNIPFRFYYQSQTLAAK